MTWSSLFIIVFTFFWSALTITRYGMIEGLISRGLRYEGKICNTLGMIRGIYLRRGNKRRMACRRNICLENFDRCQLVERNRNVLLRCLRRPLVMTGMAFLVVEDRELSYLPIEFFNFKAFRFGMNGDIEHNLEVWQQVGEKVWMEIIKMRRKVAYKSSS